MLSRTAYIVLDLALSAPARSFPKNEYTIQINYNLYYHNCWCPLLSRKFAGHQDDDAATEGGIIYITLWCTEVRLGVLHILQGDNNISAHGWIMVGGWWEQFDHQTLMVKQWGLWNERQGWKEKLHELFRFPGSGRAPDNCLRAPDNICMSLPHPGNTW